MTEYSARQHVILSHVALNTSINGTEYVLESRLVGPFVETSFSEYRVLLGGAVVKNWTRGEIDQYFLVAREPGK
jgi:hypothetical protein